MGFFKDINNLLKRQTGVSIPNDRLPKQSLTRNANEGVWFFSGVFSDAISIDVADVMSKNFERAYAAFAQTVISMNSTIDISSDTDAATFLKRFHTNITKFESTLFDSYDDDEVFIESVQMGMGNVTSGIDGKYAAIYESKHGLSKTMMDAFIAGMQPSLSSFRVEPIYNVNPVYEASSNPTASDILNGMAKNNVSKRNTDLNKAIPSVLKDNEVKKINDYAPFQLGVRLIGVNDRNEFVQYIDFVIGIKFTANIVKSEELISNVVRAIENNGVIFKFLRWTTGEKTFFKDLLLNLNEVKLDIANQSRGASAWWNTLKRMKERAPQQKLFFKKSQFLPNATLIISSLEVDYIERNYGYDLNDVNIAKKLMDALFLMGLTIVDDGSKVVKILYDGRPSYEMYSLETLEKAVTGNSNKLGRELIRMVRSN